MISPYPIHKEKKGICADCHNDTLDMVGKAMGIEIPEDLKAHEQIVDSRPKIKGKHMVIQKSQAQILMEKRKRELGQRYY